MPHTTALLDGLAQIIGSDNILSDPAQSAAYLEEPRGLFASDCLAIVKPASTEQVSACVKLCSAQNISIVPIGGNTGLCGGAVANSRQIILSLERLNNIRQIDTQNYSITVESGCILENIQSTAEDHNRLFPLSLGAQGSCQIGGNLATNAGGINVLHYGNARDLCLGIEVVLPSGEIYADLGGLRKDNTGYSLKHLFIGSEGTLGIITAATLKLFPKPVESVTALIALSDIPAAIALYDTVREASSDRVTTFELIPQIAIEFTSRHYADQTAPFDTPHAWYVLVVIHSTHPEPALADAFSNALETAFENGQIADALIAQNIAQEKQFLALREKLVLAQKLEGASIKHDISVPISRIADFIGQAEQAVQKIVPGARPYPFGHLGDGNIHYNISQPVGMDAALYMQKREAVHEAVLEIVDKLGGSFSAEHGIGILKTELIERYKGKTAYNTMRSIKHALDPKNIMNPGKVLGDIDQD